MEESKEQIEVLDQEDNITNTPLNEQNTSINNQDNNKKVCECGRLLEPNWKFCPVCRRGTNSNTNSNSSQNEINNNQQNNENNNIYICECGRKLQPGWKYCPTCKRETNQKLAQMENKIEKQKSLKTTLIFLIPYSICAIGFLVYDQFFCLYLGQIIILTGAIKNHHNILLFILALITTLYTALITLVIVLLIYMCTGIPWM